MPGMIVAKVALTSLTFRPSTLARAWASSGSQPVTVVPLAATNSFGGRGAPGARVSVPLDLMAAGTSVAIFAFAEVVVVDGVVVVAALLLLPPQPAARTATRETSARLPSETFKRCIFDPFRCWEPGSNPDLANENPKRAR